VTSRSLLCKNAFSMSARIAVEFILNLISNPQISCKSTGPLNKHTVVLLFVDLVFADESETTLVFVVVCCWVTTAWWGCNIAFRLADLLSR